ncbi:MAG: hypothetical protein H6739_36935 [Alphaproteobacteria bacterium]|nr:hypothetical protein [Alphaproteobacteria bacterium]
MSELDYGAQNPHVIGTLMKEAVRRAIVAIRAQRFTFEAEVKGRRASGKPDLVTNADHEAQRVYIKLLRDWFPTYGIVAEEDALSVPCTHGPHDLWFTVDPLDGTSAFVRRQSHGVGTMLALVRDGQVIAACVGDVMTQEVYALRPDSTVVFRISEFGFAEALSIDAERPLSKQHVLLRERPAAYAPRTRRVLAPEGGLFQDIETTSGSIGISIARLWKGEVGAAVFLPYRNTPWDTCPVIGLSRALGFVFLRLDPDGGPPTLFELPVTTEPYHMDHELMLIHQSRLDEVAAWWSRNP